MCERAKKVLVMDDEELIRESILEILTGCGYRADGACDGEQAVELYRRAMAEDERYDAVILDLRVPAGLGGRGAADRLRQIDPGVRAIAASGYSDHNVLASYQEFGFCNILAKPFTCQELVDAVNRAANP